MNGYKVGSAKPIPQSRNFKNNGNFISCAAAGGAWGVPHRAIWGIDQKAHGNITGIAPAPIPWLAQGVTVQMHSVDSGIKPDGLDELPRFGWRRPCAGHRKKRLKALIEKL